MASKDLKDAVPELEQKIPLIIKDYESMFPERKLEVICSLRSTEEQQHLYAIGRTLEPIGRKYIVTQKDGVTKLSKHNPTPTCKLSRAVDFGVFVGGKYITQIEYYYPLLDLARKYDLISGLDFSNTGQTLEQRKLSKNFKDAPHIEVKEK